MVPGVAIVDWCFRMDNQPLEVRKGESVNVRGSELVCSGTIKVRCLDCMVFGLVSFLEWSFRASCKEKGRTSVFSIDLQ